ncbi:tyrosine-protein phosphatase [Enterococcus timonensis]|uniref:tyrosine-protein phosphatase n=1 Tax=Enterococcus timonensis TaxID=1852364 RepID=UPI0008D96107|nr:tyrosine-protein phosphatase [Enterococcus timonensis]
MDREIRLQGGFNFRELGGLENIHGQKIKSKKIIRAAALEQLTAEDLTFLENYGVTEVLDFRTKEEMLNAPDQLIARANYFQLPVFKEDETQSTITPTALFEKILAGQSGQLKMEEAYRDFVIEKQARETYAIFFKHLLSDQSVIFHCTAGKDRTGFAAFLLLSALEVPTQTIWDDYLLTNISSDQRVKFLIQEAKNQQVPDLLVENIYDLLVAKTAYLQTSIDTIAENFGSVNHFLQDGLHLTNADLNDLKKIYLD